MPLSESSLRCHDHWHQLYQGYTLSGMFSRPVFAAAHFICHLLQGHLMFHLKSICSGTIFHNRVSLSLCSKSVPTCCCKFGACSKPPKCTPDNLSVKTLVVEAEASYSSTPSAASVSESEPEGGRSILLM